MPMQLYYKVQLWLTRTCTQLLQTAQSSLHSAWSEGLLCTEETTCASASGLLRIGLTGRKKTLDNIISYQLYLHKQFQ